MVTPFEFATAAHILFGEGKVREAPAAAAAMGRRALLVTGVPPELAAPLVAGLQAAGVACVPLAVTGEPTIEMVRRGNEYARAERCDLVIGMGGGSAMDAGKALAAMLANPGDPLDYLEVIGRGQPLGHASAPF
ncbi:MAG TPA: iron-containing alcohol dehydrogenase, partial [Bryobacteraceae bacterium]|nr:iron-containing alcohol dehydrogenase [Bryobacteraceae bacterium]